MTHLRALLLGVLFAAAGLTDPCTLRDLAGHERVTLAHAPAIALRPHVV